MNTTGSPENNNANSNTDAVPKPPDGGWGWIVVFSAFVILFVADAVLVTFSILYEELLKEFKESKATTSVASSVMFSTYLLVGPVAGWLVERYGCRKVTILGSVLATFGLAMSAIATNILYVIFTAGLCTGTGLGTMYVTSIVSVSIYFEDKRAFATGIATSGSGIGIVVLSPFIQLMVELMGWRSAMLIIAGVTLNCSVFGSSFRPLENRGGKRKQKTTTKSDYHSILVHYRRLMRDKAFLLYIFANFIIGFGFYVPYVYFENFIFGLGIANAYEASYLLSIMGISNTLGGIIFGYISSYPRVNRFWVYSSVIIVCGLATSLSCLCVSYTLMGIYASTFGITAGCFLTLTSVVLVDIVGLDLLTTAFGITLVLAGISCLIGPPVVGMIFDFYGSYTPGFLLAGCLIILGGVMSLFIQYAQRKQQQPVQKAEATTTNIPVNKTVDTNTPVCKSSLEDPFPEIVQNRQLPTDSSCENVRVRTICSQTTSPADT